MRLAAERGDVRLSLFASTSGQDDACVDDWGGRALLRRAEQTMRASDSDRAAVQAVIDASSDLLGESWLWERPGQGLALFASPGRTQCFWLPLPVPELVTVGERFSVSPLLPIVSSLGQFAVLVLTSDRHRLYRATRSRLDEVALPGSIPDPAADNGNGDARPDFEWLDHQVGELLGNSAMPLVLLGEQRRRDRFVRTSRHLGPLLPTGPGGPDGPDGLTQEDIRRSALRTVEPELLREEDEALRGYEAASRAGRAVVDVTRMLAAARRGCVDTLFVATARTPRPQEPGTSPVFRLAEGVSPLSLLEQVATAVLRHDGSVVTLEPGRMPAPEPMTATLHCSVAECCCVLGGVTS